MVSHVYLVFNSTTNQILIFSVEYLATEWRAPQKYSFNIDVSVSNLCSNDLEFLYLMDRCALIADIYRSRC